MIGALKELELVGGTSGELYPFQLVQDSYRVAYESVPSDDDSSGDTKYTRRIQTIAAHVQIATSSMAAPAMDALNDQKFINTPTFNVRGPTGTLIHWSHPGRFILESLDMQHHGNGTSTLSIGMFKADSPTVVIESAPA